MTEQYERLMSFLDGDEAPSRSFHFFRLIRDAFLLILRSGFQCLPAKFSSKYEMVKQQIKWRGYKKRNSRWRDTQFPNCIHHDSTAGHLRLLPTPCGRKLLRGVAGVTGMSILFLRYENRCKWRDNNYQFWSSIERFIFCQRLFTLQMYYLYKIYLNKALLNPEV